jgi:predicted RNA-binding protein with PIN domain
VTFLIDGYNLMHAAGLAHRAMTGSRFDRARTRFLDWLADSARDRAELRVIFDAQQAPAPSLETVHRGVRVRFAFRQTADDLIEALVADEPRPELLAVVSNDTRVREAAQRAGCAALTCAEFIDWLISPADDRQQPERTSAPESDKPQPTPGEVNEFLSVFNKPKPKR